MTDDSLLPLPTEYGPLLEELKEQIRTAQVRAVVAVNRELVLLYWGLGKRILAAQSDQGWGTKVIERLSRDLAHAFPDMKGFSPRNLKYMRAFAAAWPDEPIVQQVVAQIPWGHNVVLLDRLKTPEERLWYARQTTQYGWSRSVLAIQIETRLHSRQGKALTNFERTLPPPHSDLAREITKDPYNFEFLTLRHEAEERELEAALLTHLQRFLLELGVGFAFLGRQYRLEVAGDEFFLDLLFYHVRLHCYVVIELKAGTFKPEYAGKLNFYLSAADDLLRTEGDAPTIGLLLCRTKNELVVEYALRNLSSPIGVSSYELLESLPAELRSSFPTVEELEAELQLELVERPGEPDS
jgi:predicted nuclease of restriction endonuclease-like (RecB) superfamily